VVMDIKLLEPPHVQSSSSEDGKPHTAHAIDNDSWCVPPRLMYASLYGVESGVLFQGVLPLRQPKAGPHRTHYLHSHSKRYAPLLCSFNEQVLMPVVQ
jgi:hypothetical protein